MHNVVVVVVVIIYSAQKSTILQYIKVNTSNQIKKYIYKIIIILIIIIINVLTIELLKSCVNILIYIYAAPSNAYSTDHWSSVWSVSQAEHSGRRETGRGKRGRKWKVRRRTFQDEWWGSNLFIPNIW